MILNIKGSPHKEYFMRIVTRPDFDGIVCAALLYEAEKIDQPTLWVQPSDMQKGNVPIESTDIIANLPYHEKCGLWFDHHVTNRPNKSFKGAFAIAPSAARVIYDHYKTRFKHDYDMLIRQTDDIDSANLTRDQVRQPEQYPHVLISMTISGQNTKDESYWNGLVRLLRRFSVQDAISTPEVADRCEEAVARNNAFEELLIQHTRLEQHVAVTDFRSLWPAPDGNRFLVYSLFPDASVHIRIRYADPELNTITVSVGRSIFNKTCKVNVGMMLARFGGGGHAGAGACTFPVDAGNTSIPEIINILKENQEVES